MSIASRTWRPSPFWLAASLMSAVLSLSSARFHFAAADSGTPPDAFAQNARLGRGVNVLGYDPIWRD